jgi:hypothetical protein
MEAKLACSCGQHVLVDLAAGGQEFNCPACGAIMVVPTEAEASPVLPIQAEAPPEAAQHHSD